VVHHVSVTRSFEFEVCFEFRASDFVLSTARVVFLTSADQPPLAAAQERHVPFLELLGVRPVEASRGRAVFELTVEDKHLRTLGLLHGGVTATLLDTALGYAAVTTAPSGHFVVTVQLNANFIRPAWLGERLLASGEVIHSGRQTAVARGEIRTADGELVASGTGTFMYVPQSGPTVVRQPSPPPPATRPNEN
jgi:acyl-CoA thioesterase